MKLMPYVKKGLTLFIKDIRMMAISFLVLPMALALIYGNMQRDLFEGKSHSFKAVRVDFKYNKSSVKGTVLSSILSQKEIGEFINQQDEKADYTVTIDQDFKTVQIKGKDQGDERFMVLKNFVAAVINGFNQNEVIQERVNSLNMNEAEKAILIKNIMEAMGKSQESKPISEKIVEGYKRLNSVEYYTISMFSFTSLIMIVTLASYYYKEIKDGIVKRTLSTPNNRIQYFLGFVATAFMISIILSLVYIIINRLRGVGFLGNPLHIAAIMILQCILSASIVGFVIAFIKKEMTANILMNVLFVVPSMFGGVFFYSEIIESKVLKTIMNSVPNTLILNSYKDLAITGSFSAVQGEITIMAVLSVILLAIGIIKVQAKWEV